MSDEHMEGQMEGIEQGQLEEEAVAAEQTEQNDLEGKIRISEDVIAQIAVRALASVEGVVPAAPGLMANLRMGRKAVGGVRIAISEGERPEIQVDTYVSVKYGLRIPDVCWDVQEAIKEQVENYSGYAVKSVNVYVQGITFVEKKIAPDGTEVEEEINTAGADN